MSDNSISHGRALSQNRFTEAAETLGIDAAKLWAVMEVEAKRCGFLDDRRPVILFERHKFHQRTGGKHTHSYPDISSKDAGGYGRAGSHQHLRFERAAGLDRAAAIWSTSWGLGQVMGFNAKVAGFADEETMVREMCASEDAQLTGLVNFVKHNNLDRPLRVGDWTSFARGYNGPKYHINKYDDRLRGAYLKFTAGPMPDMKVREAQILLTYLSLDPGLIDGWLGPSTLRALNEYKSFFRQPSTETLTDDDVAELREAAHGTNGRKRKSQIA
ncbi:N-acetylmuramidase domain-containing protein [Aurantimonas litoralis]|nr:N-acetylmuramidase domain-containing protein [Aurantimonas litoralis]